ncbi:hypothetical protein IV203_024779 [Nitzschia inconspicua]|uniref:Uncharacterized protein n=1 Tax=Nitzschia inconspicua TaxID=303405 RepID=A0A9K3K916_9STRA|nr:hypothetical protein IV203_024779 [Nitzschia inconspicua]
MTVVRYLGPSITEGLNVSRNSVYYKNYKNTTTWITKTRPPRRTGRSVRCNKGRIDMLHDSFRRKRNKEIQLLIHVIKPFFQVTNCSFHAIKFLVKPFFHVIKPFADAIKFLVKLFFHVTDCSFHATKHLLTWYHRDNG